MFKCAMGDHYSKPGTKATKLVLEEREVTFKDGHKGKQIAKEILVCSDCIGEKNKRHKRPQKKNIKTTQSRSGESMKVAMSH